MNYRDLSDADLVDFAKNVESRLAAHEVTCLDNALADDLAATLTPINTTFETVIEMAVEATAGKQSMVADKFAQREVILERLSTVRNYLTATDGPPMDFELCGFTYRKAPATIVANDPTGLSGAGTSNGVNTIEFNGNNKSGTVVYEIWRRHGDSAPWGFLAIIKKQRFTDTPVTPGQYYEYKVRAVASSNISNWSNTAVVYGAP